MKFLILLLVLTPSVAFSAKIAEKKESATPTEMCAASYKVKKSGKDIDVVEVKCKHKVKTDTLTDKNKKPLKHKNQ